MSVRRCLAPELFTAKSTVPRVSMAWRTMAVTASGWLGRSLQKPAIVATYNIGSARRRGIG